MKKIIGILAIAITTLGFSSHAMALAPFKKAFQKKYLVDHKDEAFQGTAKKAGCNLCHVKDSKKKSVNNEYGQILKKLIEGDAKDRIAKASKTGGPTAKKAETEKVLKELDAAFEKAAKEKSEGGKGPTFGELIKAGKLPVTIEAANAKFAADQKKTGDSATEVK